MQRNRERPEEKYNDSLNIKISPELHKKMVVLTACEDIYLKTMVEKAMQVYIRDKICDFFTTLNSRSR